MLKYERRLTWSKTGPISLFMVTDSAHDASYILALIRSEDIPGVAVELILPQSFGHIFQEVHPLDDEFFRKYSGQVRMSVACQSGLDQFDVTDITDKCQALATSYGKIVAWTLEHTAFPTVVFRVEFDSIKSTQCICEHLGHNSPGANETGLAGLVVTAAPYYSYNPPPYRNGHSVSPLGVKTSREAQVTTPPSSKANSPDKANVVFSPTGRTCERIDVNGNKLAGPGYNQLPQYYQHDRTHGSAVEAAHPFDSPESMTSPTAYRYGRDYGVPDGGVQSFDEYDAYDIHSGYRSVNTRTGRPITNQAPRSQELSVDRIRTGSDVRTTIMIRNLPKAWRATQFHAMLDSCCRAEYDFSYLRFDFANDRAVGYAFVNFTSTNAVLRFIAKYVGMNLMTGKMLAPPDPHARPNSPEERYAKHYAANACGVSYANVQGIECLTTKFRNSSILKEAGEYQPRLWWTPSDAPTAYQVGHQKPWPASDNPAKLQRSIENAGQQGLFRTPRGRRLPWSQHDRGTPAQQHQEQLNNWYMHYGYETPFVPQQLGWQQPMPTYGGFNSYTAAMTPMQPYAPQGYYAPPPMLSPSTNHPIGSMLRTQTNGFIGHPHIPAWPPHQSPTFGNASYNRELVVASDAGRFEPSHQQYANDANVPRVFQERVDPEVTEG